MEALEFFNELNRMCDKYSKNEECSKECPLYEIEHIDTFYGAYEIGMFDIMRENPKQLVEIVDDWSKEHPKKTIAEDFFEKHPDANKFENGTPKVCAAYCGYCTDCRLDDYGDRDCYSCWNMPIE